MDEKRPEFLIKWKISGEEHIKSVQAKKVNLQ